MSFQIQNVFDAILRYGHDEDFQPQTLGNWRPTNAIAGTTQKLEILRNRVELGVPLFHPNDNPECLCSSSDLQPKMPAIQVIKLRQHRTIFISE